MSRRKTAIKDPFYRKIVEGLNEQSLDPTVFEHCMGDLLRDDFPGLVPVPGGSDSGWDGEIPDADGEPFPLVCTTGDALRNLTKNLTAIDRAGKFPKRKVVLATAQALTAPRRQALRQRAKQRGFKLIQIIEQQALADRLYRSSRWTKELLGLSGTPSALSGVPYTRRPLLELEPIGRDEELKWLQKSRQDRVLYGEPGSGKTFLFYHLIHRRGWDALFLASRDMGAVANALRDQQPAIVVVDDAHEDPDLLTSLVRLRRQIGDDFQIVAATWPGGREQVAEALGGLAGSQLRKLELLTRAEILEVILQVGVQGSDEVLRDLVDQSANKPGLAVTIATFWLQGLWQEVLEGTVLSRNLLNAFRGLVGEKAAVVLAAFGLGGDRGMGIEEVRDFLHVDWAEFHQLTSGLAVGGVLSEVEKGVLAVWPRQLRWALVRSVFFQEACLPYRPLLARAPNPASAVEGLVWARHRGATVPDSVLRDLVAGAGSRQAWEWLAALGPELARWALDHYPGTLVDIAGGALRGDAKATIPRLLDQAVGATGPAHSHPEHPMRILEDWVRELRVPTEEMLRRRQLLGTAARRFLLAGGKGSVGVQGICIALCPTLKGYSSDPVAGRTVTFQTGIIPPSCLPGLVELWEQVSVAIPEVDAESWIPLRKVLWEWIDPEPGLLLPYEEMHAFARRMLNDLAPRARQSPGLARGLQQRANQLGMTLPLDPDPTFDALYPEDSKFSSDHLPEWEREKLSAARALGRELAEHEPQAVAEKLRFYEAEAQRIDHHWPRMTPVVCEELAVVVTDHRTWSTTFRQAGLPGDLLRPFDERAARDRQVGWEQEIQARFESKESRWLAADQVLQLEGPPEHLLALALTVAGEFPRPIETLCLRRQVPLPTLRRLLRHPCSETAQAAATGEWAATPGGGVRPEIFVDWRVAILGEPEEELTAGRAADRHTQYWLGEILASDPELAQDWLRSRIVARRRLSISTDVLKKAVSALSREQRIQLVEQLDLEAVPFDLVPLLVGRDPDVFRSLLVAKKLKPYHLEPLHGMPDDRWIDLALLAMEGGYEPEAVAKAVFGGIDTWWGSELEYWQRWEEAFARLEGDPRPQVRDLGVHGRQIAERWVEKSSHEEKRIALEGR